MMYNFIVRRRIARRGLSMVECHKHQIVAAVCFHVPIVPWCSPTCSLLQFHRLDLPARIDHVRLTWDALLQCLYSCQLLVNTLSPKKRSHFYFLNNSVKNEPILTIFGTRNPEGTW